MKLGETVEDSKDFGGDIWIKTFKDGETRIRFCQEPNKFVKWTEHYWRPAGYFPCTKQVDCVGCINPDEEVSKVRLQYYVNAMNDQGQLNVFRLGVKLKKYLDGRIDRFGTIMDRDFTIIREGKGLETSYTGEPGEKYELDKWPTELHDITSVLGAKYLETQKIWDEFVSDGGTEGGAPTQDEVAAAQHAVEETLDVSKAAKAKPKAKETPVKKAEEDYWENMGTADIQEAIEKARSNGQDVPDIGPRTPRSQLIEIAKSLPPF